MELDLLAEMKMYLAYQTRESVGGWYHVIQAADVDHWLLHPLPPWPEY